MNILFYSPFNNRSRDTESLMIAFRQQGNRVISLSQAGGAFIHPVLRSHDIETYSHIVKTPIWPLFYIRHLLFFIKFCRINKVDIVYSHLEPANSVASLGQYFIRARVFLCRHHVDEALLQKFNRSLAYRLTYFLARRIIVVSERARSYMIQHEDIPAKKIIKINLAYDFSLFPEPDPDHVNLIRSRSSGIRLLTISRLTKYKRVDLSIQVLHHLKKKGLDVSLFILGEGEEMNYLREIVRDQSLTDYVFFEGYRQNVQDYLAATDYLLHPSVLESSCVVVKEAAIYGLPVIVCSEVGDFDDYIVHQLNGYKIEPEKFLEYATHIIYNNVMNHTDLKLMTDQLKELVVSRFSINGIIEQYNKLNAM